MRNKRSTEHLAGWAILLAILACAQPARAQQTLALLPSNFAGPAPSAAPIVATPESPRIVSSIIVPDSKPRPVREVVEETQSSRRDWLILAVVQHGAAAFDAYSTRRSIQSGGVELNPFMKPFAHSNGLYAAMQVTPVLLDLVARRMQHSHNSLVRRMWWIPQSVDASASMYAGVNNLRVTAEDLAAR